MLGLDLCWEDGQLRWYDPATGRYLLTYDEEAAGRLAAERERDAALERVRELEDQVRRLQSGYQSPINPPAKWIWRGLRVHSTAANATFVSPPEAV